MCRNFLEFIGRKGCNNNNNTCNYVYVTNSHVIKVKYHVEQSVIKCGKELKHRRNHGVLHVVSLYRGRLPFYKL